MDRFLLGISLLATLAFPIIGFSGGNLTNSTAQGTGQANQALAVSISANTVSMQVNQTLLLSASASGGAPPYSYTFYKEVNGNASSISQCASVPDSTCAVTPKTAGPHAYYASAADSVNAIATSATVNVSVNATSVATIPTTSANTTSTTATTSVPAAGQLNLTGQRGLSTLAYNSTSGARAGHVTSYRRRAAIDVGGGPIRNITVGFASNQTRSFNISITAFTKPSCPAGFYRCVAINESVPGIDSDVVNATYNFSVPQSWVAQEGVNSTNILLFKNISSGWQALPTMYTGANSTSYFYSALSNSLSVYAVGFTSSSGVASGNTNPETATASAGTAGQYTMYFWSGAASIWRGTSNAVPAYGNWISQSNAIYTGGSGTRKMNQTSVGYNAVYVGTWSDTTAAGVNMTLAGVGANVIYANQQGGAPTVANSVTGSILNLNVNPVVAGSFAVILFALAGNIISTVGNVPSGCTQIQAVNERGRASSWIYTCNSMSTGNSDMQETALAASGAAHDALSAAAYIFPPYTVTLNENALGGSIAANGGTFVKSGDTMNVIGSSTFNAIPPANFVFTYWGVPSGSANVVIGTTQSTTLWVMGNAVIVANYNGLGNFIQTGLPASTTWNVMYNTNTLSANTVTAAGNTISFSVKPGSYSYSVANQVVNGNTYVPSPATGTMVAGNTISIAFSTICGISLSVNAISFGTVKPGSNTVTTGNLVTDTNSGGTVQAVIWAYGGNWMLGGSFGFGVTNTVYASKSSNTYASAALLTGISANTGIMMTASGGAYNSNSIYFGLGIPGGQAAATYTQNIIILNTC